MIKNSAEIRQFTPEQKRQLVAISETEKIKNANDVLLFALDKYQDLVNENARLKRLLEFKKLEIKKLKENQMDLLAIFKKAQLADLTNKEAIVARLLEIHAISVEEAAVLLKTIDISITADKLEMSSGAKIIGGSDFENHVYR